MIVASVYAISVVRALVDTEVLILTLGFECRSTQR